MSVADRYLAAAHAMQSGVAAKLGLDEKDGIAGECSPKHLRVGVNSAMVDHAALVGLLIKNGIITQDDYGEAVAGQMETEARNYEAELAHRLGTKVTLG